MLRECGLGRRGHRRGLRLEPVGGRTSRPCWASPRSRGSPTRDPVRQPRRGCGRRGARRPVRDGAGLPRGLPAALEHRIVPEGPVPPRSAGPCRPAPGPEHDRRVGRLHGLGARATSTSTASRRSTSATSPSTTAPTRPPTRRRRCASPMTMEDYLSARMIRWPLCLLDMDVPVDGADAFVVTTAERARDLPLPPVLDPRRGAGHGRQERRGADGRPRPPRSAGDRARRSRRRATSGSTTATSTSPTTGSRSSRSTGSRTPAGAGAARRASSCSSTGTRTSSASSSTAASPSTRTAVRCRKAATQGSGHLREAVHQLQGRAGETPGRRRAAGDRHHRRLLLQRTRRHAPARLRPPNRSAQQQGRGFHDRHL